MNTTTTTNNNTLITCNYCKNIEINGHTIADCPRLIEKAKIQEYKKRKEEKNAKRRQDNKLSNLAKVKCHWCDQLGHYKSDCKIMEFFIMEDERVRRDLRYAMKKEYQEKFPDLTVPLKEVEKEVEVVKEVAVKPLRFSWVSVASHGIPDEILKQNAKEDTAAKREFNNKEYRRKKQTDYEARIQKKEDERNNWKKIRPVIEKMKQTYPNTWQDKVEGTSCDTTEAANRRWDIDEKERYQEALEERDEMEYLNSFSKEHEKRSKMNKKELERYDRDLDDMFDAECASQHHIDYCNKFYLNTKIPESKICEGCSDFTERGNHSELCIECIFNLKLR